MLRFAASIAFFVASAAAMLEPAAANAALVAYPYALGSVLYTLGARLYKRSALEGLQASRRRHSRAHEACHWARTEVRGARTFTSEGLLHRPRLAS